MFDTTGERTAAAAKREEDEAFEAQYKQTMRKQSFMGCVDEQAQERQKTWDEHIEDHRVKPLEVKAPAQREEKYSELRPWAHAVGSLIAQIREQLMVNNPRNAYTFGGRTVVKAGRGWKWYR